ncbi:MAG: sodium-dependent transporter [Desulfatibacillum sp.]|nr:sodium-dependent transporter [Desulfatibacillum sp.]
MKIDPPSQTPRETWSSSFGFIAACMGAAIGLGNIWLFPWRLGRYGGAAFLIPYLLFVFGLVRFGLAAELALGRREQRGPMGAFIQVFGAISPKLGMALGAVPVLAVTGILVFYTIVLGWIMKYFWLFLTRDISGMDPVQLFEGLAGHSSSIPWHVLAVALTALIAAQGVQGGLERINKAAMPLLFGIMAILLVRSLTLPGAMEGVIFLARPDWSCLGDIHTWIMALGQSFFTVSLGGMLIYGSYLNDTMDIPRAALTTAIMNSLASFMAAFVIIPAAFAFGLDPAAGPDLLFVTMPKIFDAMPGGRIYGSLFFFSVILAGLSSAINLVEVPVETLMDQLGMTRKKAALLVACGSLAVGMVLDLHMGAFEKWVDLFTIYLLPAGALLIAAAMLWVLGPQKALEAVNKGCRRPWGRPVILFLAWVFVPTCVLVLILGIVLGGIG